MKKLLIPLFALLFVTFLYPSSCYANAAEPPAIIIIVPDAPDDLEISIGDDKVFAQRTDKVIESHYSFYKYDLQSLHYAIMVITADESFEIALDTPPQTYQNIYTLDLNNRKLIPGESLKRSVAMVFLRIILTLIFEAGIFYLFGYRKKRSWLVFLIANLLTQCALNIWLASSVTPGDSYIVLNLIFGEFCVFVIELAVFLFAINEHRRWRTALYVLVANVVSLIVGGYLITVFPV